MKKLFCLFLAAASLIALASCKPGESDVTDAVTTGKPDATTSAPDVTTVKPDDTTAAPAEDTTTVPADTTTVPEDTTIPEDTTTVPEDTTTVPEDTTVTPPTADVSGTFKSNTGTSINLRAEYTLSGGVLKVEFYLDYYTLSVSPKILTVIINGEKYTCSAAAIEEIGEGRHSTLIAADEYKVTGSEITLSASFTFRGEYAGVPLESIDLTGTIK